MTHADFIAFDQKKIDDRLLSLQRRDENAYSLIERKGFLRMHLKNRNLQRKRTRSISGCGRKIMILHFRHAWNLMRSGENEQAGDRLLSESCKSSFDAHLRWKREEKAAGNRTYNRKRYAACGRRNQCKRKLLELYLKAAGQRAEFFVRDEEGKVLKLIKDVSLLPYSTEEAGGFVGCTLGVYASSNGEMSDRFADVAWISYEGIPG